MDTPDLERLSRELAVRKRLQEALLVFSRAVSANLSLPAALATLAGELTALFGTGRTSIWLHDREARLLRLAASSDLRDPVGTAAIRTHEDSPLTRALRANAAELSGAGAGQCLVVPLRGWRRALGALAIDGPSCAVPSDLFVELSGDLARQLAISVESVLVLEDVIRRHADFEQLRLQAAHGRNLASIGQNVASIAHQMTNPLQGVLGHLELLIASPDTDPAHRTHLARVYNDAERVAGMVDDLLTFGGASRIDKRPLVVKELVAGVIALRETTPHRPPVRLIANVADDVERIEGDAGLLQEALVNIVVNAEQAMAGAPRGGQVTISARSEQACVLIDVDDTGPGIPPEIRERVFEPFFTTKSVGQGTGLGLSIASGIVHDHGGTLTAGAAPSGGARFTIRLPAAR